MCSIFICIRSFFFQAERAWRQKELEAAKKKQAVLDDLKLERAKQIDHIRRAQALEMERDKQQFLQVNFRFHNCFCKVYKYFFCSWLNYKKKITTKR